MRFLHTADWHIGRQLRGRSRTSEQEAFLREILDIASTEKIDLLLVAGTEMVTAQDIDRFDAALREVLR